MSDIEVNPYVLLEVKVESTEQEIRTAYRQRSLKVHPDRVSTLLLIFFKSDCLIAFYIRIGIILMLVYS